MQSVKSKPVFLNLMQIRLPVAGVMSIIHRVTGVVMVLSIPLLLYLLDLSLSGPTKIYVPSGASSVNTQ